MEKTEKELLFWKRVTGGAVLGILAAMLVLAVCAILVLIQAGTYKARVDGIVDRLDAVSRQLEQVPIEEIAQAAQRISDDLEDVDIRAAAQAIGRLSAQLEDVDWDDMASRAQDSLAKAEEAMDRVAQTMDELDVEALNEAISNLQTAIEPLAALVGRFG